MTICMNGRVVHIKGDLTLSGVTCGSIDSMAKSLQQIEYSGEKNIRIDCISIRAADISGLQLLYVWMQCARFSGVESELVNLPVNLQRTIKNMDVGHCFPSGI